MPVGWVRRGCTMSVGADKVSQWLGDSSDDTDSDDSDSSDTSGSSTRSGDSHTAPATTEKQRSAQRDASVDPAAGAALPLHPAASMFAVQRSLHRTKHDLRNRLHSVHHDAAFVSAAAALFSAAGFACYANLRQGAWCRIR